MELSAIYEAGVLPDLIDVFCQFLNGGWQQAYDNGYLATDEQFDRLREQAERLNSSVLLDQLDRLREAVGPLTGGFIREDDEDGNQLYDFMIAFSESIEDELFNQSDAVKQRLIEYYKTQRAT